MLDIEDVSIFLLGLVVYMLGVWLNKSEDSPFWDALHVYLDKIVFCYLGF